MVCGGQAQCCYTSLSQMHSHLGSLWIWVGACTLAICVCGPSYSLGTLPTTSMPYSMPTQSQPVHQLFPHFCVLIATERKTGCSDQVGRTCSSRPPTCMTKGAHPCGLSGHTTFMVLSVPGTIPDQPLPSSFKFLIALRQ